MHIKKISTAYFVSLFWNLYNNCKYYYLLFERTYTFFIGHFKYLSGMARLRDLCLHNQ